MVETLKWNILSSTDYNNISIKDNKTLYLLYDTSKIYKGDVDISKVSILVDSLPQNYSLGTLYLIKGSLAGYMYDNNKWTQVVSAIVETTLNDNKLFNLPISGEAIKKYLKDTIINSIDNDFVEAISYNDVSKCIEYTLGGKTFNVALTNLLYDIEYDKLSNKLKFHFNKVKDLEVELSSTINLKNCSYDAISKQVTMELSTGKKINLNLLSILNFTDIASTKTVSANIVNNKLVIDTNISSEPNNMLFKDSSGISTLPDNSSLKMDKVDINKQKEIIVTDINGNSKTSGIKMGTDTISSEPSSNVIITELSFKKLCNYIKERIDSAIVSKMTSKNINIDSPSETKILTEEGFVTTMSFLEF